MPGNEQSPDQQDASWSYNNEPDSALYSPELHKQPDVQPISWTGSEFIARHKDTGWYAGLAGAMILISAIIMLTIKDWITVVAVIIAGTLFGIIAGRSPKQRSFMIDTKGITVDAKFFPYSDFRSFNLLRDGAIAYIDLIPLKRFMPELSLYFAPDDEQKIFDTIALYLPNEQRDEHRVDRLMRRLKF